MVIGICSKFKRKQKYRLWTTEPNPDVDKGSLIYVHGPFFNMGWCEGRKTFKLNKVVEGDVLPEGHTSHFYLLTEKGATAVTRLHGQRLDVYTVLYVWGGPSFPDLGISPRG